jgi:ATP/maltotriose-dependent transcriptional regulator MalT
MKKYVLRVLQGTGYVILLATLLLYQAGVFGERRQWVAVLGTLILGIALAVVLALYLRVNSRLTQAQRNAAAGRAAGDIGADAITAEADVEQRASDGGMGQCGRGNTFVNENRPSEPRSYEEIYAQFLTIMEACALSERELEVAWLLYRGYTNRQIGEELYIAETTVKKHVSHIYQKLGVCSRKEFRAKVREGSAPGLCSGG